jgi:hypothetical protein
MTQEDANAFARRWIADWNAHDLDAILAHYAPDAEFLSPVAQRVTGAARVIGSLVTPPRAVTRTLSFRVRGHPSGLPNFRDLASCDISEHSQIAAHSSAGCVGGGAKGKCCSSWR